MDSTKVYVQSLATLVQLKDCLYYFGDSTKKFISEVNDYLDKCLSEFRIQQDQLENEFRIAEEEKNAADLALMAAENAYSACLSSQTTVTDKNGDSHTIPSCISEQMEQETARAKADECRVKYEECKNKLEAAKQIMYETEQEINFYKFGSVQEDNVVLSQNYGGEKTLEKLANKHTELALAKMDKITETLEKYLGKTSREVQPDNRLVSSQQQVFTSAVKKVKDIQKAESTEVAAADAAMVCETCGRPTPICVCAIEN
jgi:hypothetical protein